MLGLPICKLCDPTVVDVVDDVGDKLLLLLLHCDVSIDGEVLQLYLIVDDDVGKHVIDNVLMDAFSWDNVCRDGIVVIIDELLFGIGILANTDGFIDDE